MKKSTRNIMASVTAMVMIVAPFAQAADLYWDGGSVDAGDPGNGASAGGAGTWNTTLKNWDAGAVPHVAWINGNNDIAVFGGTAGTVTNQGVTVGGMIFNTANYNVTANTLTFGAAGIISNAVNATIASSLAGTGPITKNGAGTLTLSGNNSYTGGTVLNGGKIDVATTTSDKNAVWGANGGAITFNGTAATDLGLRGGASVTLNRGITVTNGATASIWLHFGNATIPEAVTGDGTLTFLGDSGNAYLNASANTFTGPLQIDRSITTGPGPMYVYVASLADTTNRITFLSNSGGSSRFGLSSAAVAPLVLTNRVVELAASGNLENKSSSYGLTIKRDLLVTGAGAKTLSFIAGTITFGGRIADGAGAQVTVSRSAGTVYLSGTNTYSGTTENNSNSALVFQGQQAVSSATTINMNTVYQSNPTLTFLDDGAGTVALGNNVNIRTSKDDAYRNWVTFIVGNNNTANGGTSAGTTTGSTIALGNLSINDARTGGGTPYTTQGYTINIQGSNGYGLQFANVNLPIVGTTGSNQILVPTSAPLTITGIIKQFSGNTAGKVFPLELAGTAVGNLISGAIKDADDYPVNANARSLSVIKSSTSTWTLSGTNTYTGVTTISGGKLIVNGSLSTNTVTVSAGFLGGTGTVNGAVTVSGTGGLDLRDGAIGTLTVSNNLAITGAAAANNLCFDLASAGSTVDKIAATGAFSMTTSGAGVINLNQLGGSGNRLTAGTYDLITAASGMTAGGGNFTLPVTKAFGQTFSLTGTTTALQLTTTQVAGATPTAYWKGGNINWSTAANWNTDAASNIAAGAAPDYQSNVRYYTTTPVAANQANGVLDADFNINSLTFDAGATTAVTIGGTKTLTIEAAAVNGNTAGNGITMNTPSGTHTINAKIGLAANQTWTVATGGTLAVSGAISDFGAGYALTKAGGGNLTLTGATTYTGGTTITGGILTVNGTSLGSINNGPLTLSGGGRLTVSGANISSASAVSVGVGGGLMSVSGNNNFTTTGKLTGSGTLTLVDVGGGGGKAFNFNALNNDFTGGILLSGAVGLSLTVNSLADSANNIAFTATSGSVPFSYGNGAIAPLTLVSRAFEINSAGALTGTIQNNSASQAISIGANLVATGAGAKVLGLDAVAGPANVFSGNITDGTGGGTIAVSKTGAGMWTLSGNNTYSGGTTVSAGTLKANGANALGAGNVTVSAGTLQIDAANALADTAVLRLPSASAVNLVMNANDTIGALYLNGVQQPNGDYTSSGMGSGWMTGSGTLTVGPASAQPVYWDLNGSTAGAGGATPSGTWNAANTYWNDAAGTGTTNAWTSGRTAAFAAGTDATGAYDVTVDGTQDIGGMTFEEGTVTLSGGTALRLVSDAVAYVATNRTATIATPLTQDAPRQLIKSGTGTLVLSAGNSYSGATTLGAGTLQLTHTNSISSSSGLSLASGTKLQLLSDTPATFSIPTASSFTGTTIIDVGNNGSGTGNTLTIPNNITFSGTLRGTASSGYTLNVATATVSATGAQYLSADSGIFSVGKVDVNSSAGDIHFRLTGSSTGVVAAVTNVTSSGPWLYFYKEGSGTWAVSNIYSRGNGTVSAGTLVINGNGYFPNSGGSGNLTLSGGALHYNSPSALRVGASWIINGGSIDNSSGAPITTSTFNPAMAWNANFIFLGSQGTNSDLYLGTGAVTMNANRIVTINSNATLTVGGVISGAGFGLAKAGTGTLKLTGKSTYNGATTVSNGTLQVVAGGSCSNSVVTVTNTTGITSALAVVVTNLAQQSVCSNLTVSAVSGGEAQLKFSFGVAPSLTQAPLLIQNTVAFNAFATLVVDPANLVRGKTYPLLTVGGTPPGTVPTLNIAGMNGTLAWGTGPNSKTLYLTTPPAGTLIMFR